MDLLRSKGIYMDYASTTPVLPEVRRAMDKYWSKDFYNPSSIYREGVRMKSELEALRGRVARLTGAGSKDIVFTSGGTESDNMAILGTFESFRQEHPHKRGHLIISSIEHPALREAAEEVRRRGGVVSVVSVDEDGVVNVNEIIDEIRDDTFLVSVMLANNEIGTVEPIAKIGRSIRSLKKKHGSVWPYLHTDASQAPNYLDINVESLNADLMTLDGSKIYGPKGVGCLVVRQVVKLRPIILGGGQEKGFRSGTESMALIAGFNCALEAAHRDRAREYDRLHALKHYFVEKLSHEVPDTVINTPLANSLPNIISISTPGTLSEMTLLSLDRSGVMVSVGSACASSKDESGSYVIRAIGKSELAESTVRFSFGRFTTFSEVEKVVKIFRHALLRGKMSS